MPWCDISVPQKILQVASTNERVHALLARDSSYREGSEEVALRVFGTKYYQLHPFVFERLLNSG